ncbi:MAG: formylglycine-generating enzyme family protein [Planctomycetota bacterium]|jgi:formylglycine-generating enzyme required for sulfatase activity
MSRFVLAWILFGLLTGVGFGQEVTVELTNSIGMKLVLIPKGTFMMGSPESEKGHREYEVQHEVTLTRDYYLGMTEVTQAQYQKVMGENPSFFKGGKIKGDSSNHPVDNVSWDDVLAFCNGLSRLPEEKKAGRVYRLPTEAEWEYACRAGSKTAYSFADERNSPENYLWLFDNSDAQTHPVAEKKPNAWGLYDMHGNLYEWCSDWFGDYPKGAVSDPTGPQEGKDRVFRGGSWINVAADCRSADRGGSIPSSRKHYFGFRVALSSPEIPKQAEQGQDK